MSAAHIVGAGMAGLACAVRLADRGWRVELYDAAPRAGGRCRSFHDAQLDRVIDNGNHLMLSANTAALDYLAAIGAGDSLMGPDRAVFPFVDLETGERWTVEPGPGAIPWWVFSRTRRIPGTGIGDYLSAVGLARAPGDATVADAVSGRGALWDRFWEPLCLAVLNTAPEEASARLLWRVLRETFGRGAAACRPLIARHGLAASLVDPAIDHLRARGATVHFSHRLRALASEGVAIMALDFGTRTVALSPGDQVVLAVPPTGAASLLPWLEPPDEVRPIVNAHFRVAERPTGPDGFPFLGLVGGTAQWLFLRDDIISVTVSAATALVDRTAEDIAAVLWSDTARALALPPEPMPPVRIVKERRATFAQTPAAVRRRPGTRTRHPNLLLAGDWTDTGFPATIEGAIRSGQTAAGVVQDRQ
jgi:squalene-associated FAD-dependent desaturase